MRRTAIITGAESGIGAAVAERFRAAGIKVFSLDLAASADFQVDISNSEQVNNAVAQIGSVDILLIQQELLDPILRWRKHQMLTGIEPWQLISMELLIPVAQ